MKRTKAKLKLRKRRVQRVRMLTAKMDPKSIRGYPTNRSADGCGVGKSYNSPPPALWYRSKWSNLTTEDINRESERLLPGYEMKLTLEAIEQLLLRIAGSPCRREMKDDHCICFGCESKIALARLWSVKEAAK